MEVDKQQQQQHLRNTLGLTLGLMFSVNRTVQIFSRRIGSTGNWYYGVFLLVGVGVQIYYCEVNAQLSETRDTISVLVMIMATIIWNAAHSMGRLIQRVNGQATHSYDSGIGILASWFPTWQPSIVSLVSDLAVATTVGACCYLLGSPILGGWYLSVAIWLIAAECFLSVRDRVRGQRMVDARAEAEYLSRQVYRR